VIFQNEPIFSSRRCDRLMLVKASKSAELASMDLLAGSEGYTGKGQGATDSTSRGPRGTNSPAREGKFTRKLPLILSLWFQAD
jgi:hypothetical protein